MANGRKGRPSDSVKKSSPARRNTKPISSPKEGQRRKSSLPRRPHIPHVSRASPQYSEPSTSSATGKEEPAVISDPPDSSKEEKKPIINTPLSNLSSSGSDISPDDVIWGKDPVKLKCPKCSTTIMTSADPVVGKKTWIVFGILCALGLWLVCSLLPFCSESCQDIEHRCPCCGHVFGRYERWKCN